MMSSTAPQEKSTPTVLPFAHPLDEFYVHAGMQLPRIEVVAGPLVPEPYRQLLVHEGDMTPTLEKFHEAGIHLEVLRREQHGNSYFRQVLLRTNDSKKAVEFGAIKIFLDQFPTGARNDILSERLPLGTILAHCRLSHFSRPKAFVRIFSDAYINQAFGLEGNHILYGRRNTLSNDEKHPLAEIFEILPPHQS
jgi:hypothetical protein